MTDTPDQIPPELRRSGTRRRFLIATSAAGPALLLGGRARADDEEREVTATEDLMREHGILRRALLLYSESAARLRADARNLDLRAIEQTAMLFQEFGETYHERMLEEQHVFPEVKRAGGPAAALVDVLESQHRRGREITAYILATAKRGKLDAGAAATLAATLDGMARMYRAHTAHEDTVVFPAWKAALPQSRIEELGEEFEDIEHRQFGGDGFDLARDRIAAAERALGLDDLGAFTAPAPPAA
jgi:hemerythrin-like domain-containing protein